LISDKSCVNLDIIHFGKYIKQIADKNGWNQKTIGLRLNLRQNAVSRLYRNQWINVKDLVQFSNALGRNLIAEVYLTQMSFLPALYQIEDCKIVVSEHEIRIENPEDPTFLMKFRREIDK